MLPDTIASYSTPPGPVKEPSPSSNSDVPSVTSLKDITVRTPVPAGIASPEKENPITIPFQTPV